MRRSRTLSRFLATISASLLLLAGFGGARSLPVFDAPGKQATLYEITKTPPPRIRSGTSLPVFDLGEDGTVGLAGDASLADTHTLTLRHYPDKSGSGGDRRSAGASLPMLVKADVRLLWALLSPENRARMQQSLDDFAAGLTAAGRDIVASETFKRRYQARFEVLFHQAIQASMEDPDVNRALDRVMDAAGETFGSEFIQAYVANLVKQGSMALFMLPLELGKLFGGESSAEDFREQLEALFDTPETRQLMAEKTRELMESPEVARLATAAAWAMAKELLRNPRLMPLLEQLAAEPAFSSQIGRIERSSLDTANTMIRLLIGVDGDDRMHPLAAVVVRSLFFNGPQWLVIEVSPPHMKDPAPHPLPNAIPLSRRVDRS